MLFNRVRVPLSTLTLLKSIRRFYFISPVALKSEELSSSTCSETESLEITGTGSVQAGPVQNRCQLSPEILSLNRWKTRVLHCSGQLGWTGWWIKNGLCLTLFPPWLCTFVLAFCRRLVSVNEELQLIVLVKVADGFDTELNNFAPRLPITVNMELSQPAVSAALYCNKALLCVNGCTDVGSCSIQAWASVGPAPWTYFVFISGCLAMPWFSECGALISQTVGTPRSGRYCEVV